MLPGHFVHWHMTYETGDTRATLVEILTYNIWTPRTHRDKVNTRPVEGRGVDPKNIVSFLDNWIFFLSLMIQRDVIINLEFPSHFTIA